MSSHGNTEDDEPVMARSSRVSAAPWAPSAPGRSDLPDLDLDELPPLPPAHGISNAQSASLERIPSLKLNGTSRPALSLATTASATAAASPALSAAPSSFRLEGSPPSTPQRAHTPQQLPLDAQQHTPAQRVASGDQQTSHHNAQDAAEQTSRLEQTQHDLPSTAAPVPSARYVTVSAILSRSEMYYAPETSDHWDILRPPHGPRSDADHAHETHSRPSNSSEPSSSLRRRRSQKKRPSNGSAIEALGALLLRKDSSGRVANLSFVRNKEEDDQGQKHIGLASKHGSASKHGGMQAWTSALGSLKRTGLRLQLPSQVPSKATSSDSGATIAERRAQMWNRVLTRQGAVVEDTHDGFSKVRSRRGGLSFEVGTVNRKHFPSTLLQLDGYRPDARSKENDASNLHRGSPMIASVSGNAPEANGVQSSSIDVASALSGRLPDTIVLKAGRRPRLTQLSKSEFGIGSAFHHQTLPEAPPSPIAMPGAWHGGSSWRSKPGDGYEEGALLLPPPLLDDNGSDASSFEGLLGVRRMREREKARKQAEKLAARNRPAHKVGPLIALTNFVKAAHAAETSAKRAQTSKRFGQAPAFLRSFTEPQQLPRARSGSDGSLSRAQITTSPTMANGDLPDLHQPGELGTTSETASTLIATESTPSAANPPAKDAEARKSPAISSVSPFMSPASRRAVMSRRGSRTGSIDATGRQLNTVFEFEPLDPGQIPDDQLASPDLPPISSPLLRPSSRGSTKASAFRDLPAAPRLLPVQLSMPPSPFTPLATDLRETRSSMGPPASGSGDYLSARNLHVAPRTPQLAPTMLSLPPSPWTPYQDTSAVHSSPLIHLHLNTSSSSLRLAPGTPRLVPTHIEILPSPFPTAASSRRGSLTYDSPHALRATSLTRSPLTGPATDFTSFAALRDSQAANTDSKPAIETSPLAAQAVSTYDVKLSKTAQSKGSLRLTPSSMLVAAESTHASVADTDSERRHNSVAPTQPTTPAPVDNIASHEKLRSSGSRSRRSSVRRDSIHVDSSGRQRSFVLWFLIGDLGLRNRISSTDSSTDISRKDLEADHGGIVALFVHAISFFVFVAAHLVDLGYSTYEKISLILWFLRWTIYNLSGRTVLAQCVIEAYGFIQAEWATVAIEDHEEKGSKRKSDGLGIRKPKGLSRWQVLRGLLELYCLHSVTRERYLAEGAGLKELDGWRRTSKQQTKAKVPKPRGSDRLDIGAQRAASRAALEKGREIWPQQEDDDELDSTFAQTNAHQNQVDDDSEEVDGDSSDDDDEMIVTNRDDDILEFAKTPRMDAMRPGQASSGYFGRAYDFMTSPQVGASQPGVVNRDLRPFKENNRDLVRTIKWCGRLAISAYGLHVHIVDLPPTFTPSGERFSRQTFAYLSRLNADDVLHADIQTLDADADYSPTFYIVRDYVRKVVCVAVRGTQSFSDIIVDLELQTEEIELPQVQPTPGEEFRCHAGIWRAAKALVSPQSKLFATLRQALVENEGFGIMFCGHSLGGAIASAAALLLAEYFIPDGAELDAGTWVTNMSSGLPARRPIRAVSFASPVTMTADLASRAALGSVPLVTTVVLGSDVIPRVGHGQVRELRRVLGALSRVRRRHAMASTEGQDDARIHILRSYWDWRSISMAEDADDVMLHRKERIEKQLWSLRREVESDLYAAIKARLDAESTTSARIPPSPWVGPQQRDQAPLHALSARRQELDTATLRSEAAQGGPLVPPGRCIWINDKHIYHVESPLAFFSLPELRSDMFAAHFPAAYEEAILDLRT